MSVASGSGPVLSKAYVQIIPSMRGFGKQMEKELGGNGPGGLVPVGKRAGGKLAKGLTTGVKVAGGSIAAAFGGSLVKGFNRLKSLENAEASLRGMGMAADEIEVVMKNANKAVRGTAFGMDEAAGSASLLSVAGVEAGKDMERHLTLVADLAAQTNSGMGEMSSIYGKVAANGKLTGEVAQQLLDRNINAYSLVADHLDITTEAAQKMGRDGEITFELFADAMESRVSGAAQEMGNTTEGAFKNMGAAAGRFGAALLEKVYPLFAPVFKKITEWIDKATEHIGGAIDWISDLFEGFGKSSGSALAPVGDALNLVKDVATNVWDGVRGAFESAWQFISPIVDSLVGAIENNIVPVLQVLWEHAKDIFGRVQGIVQQVWTVIEPIVADVRRIIVEDVGPAIQSAVTAVGEVIQFVWDYVVNPVFTALKNFVLDVLAPVFTWFLENIIKPVWTAVSGAISSAWDIIRGVFDTITSVLRGDFAGAWRSIQETISEVWGNIWGAIKGVWDNHIFPFLKSVGGKVDDWFVQPFRDAVGAIGRAWDGIKSAFASPINWVIRNVINNGVIAMVNKITSALGLGNKLSPVSEIGVPSSGSKSGRGGGSGGSMKFGAFAKGGKAPRGWALVGEEGPELVNFSNPGRVYTADETAEAFTRMGSKISPALIPDRKYTQREAAFAAAALKDGSQDALKAAQPLLPVGGFLGSFTKWVSSAWNGATDFVMDVGGKVVNFARGKLADGAELVLNPLNNLIRSNVQGVWGDVFVGLNEKFVSWLRGVDKKTEPMVPVAGSFDDLFKGLGITGPMVKGGARPVRGGVLTSRFGPRWGGHHAGVDFAVPVGTPLFAYQSGTVRRTGWNSLAGRTGIGTEILHAGGLGTYYGHQSRSLVKVGQQVKQGQMIGLSGNTGRSTGPHLHFEMSRGGNPHNVFDPLTRLYDQGGWLKPGVSLVENKTRKPEPVLTSGQWASVERAVDNTVNGGRGPVTFNFLDRDGTLKMSFQAEAEAVLVASERWSR